MDKELLREMEAMLVESEDPVKQRIRQIKKNRKRAEENRVKRMQKRQEEEDMITEIAAELDEMMLKLHNMGKWFEEFEREVAVEQASQFEYSQLFDNGIPYKNCNFKTCFHGKLFKLFSNISYLKNIFLEVHLLLQGLLSTLQLSLQPITFLHFWRPWSRKMATNETRGAKNKDHACHLCSSIEKRERERESKRARERVEKTTSS